MARELAIENGKLKSNLDANGNKVANIAAPTSDNDAATKKYVDEHPTPPPSWSDITGKPDAFPPEAHSHESDSWFTSALEAIKSWASSAFAAITHSHESDSWFTTALGGKLDKTYGTATDLTVIEPLTIQASTGGNSAMFSVGTDDGVLYISGPSDLNFGSSTRTLNQINDKLNELDDGMRYSLYAVPSTGLLKDRAINTTSLASVTVPDGFTDLLIRASVSSSLAVTMPSAITTKYGDTFPAAAGEYLITITKTGAAEAYVRVIKLEVAQ